MRLMHYGLGFPGIICGLVWLGVVRRDRGSPNLSLTGPRYCLTPSGVIWYGHGLLEVMRRGLKYQEGEEEKQGEE